MPGISFNLTRSCASFSANDASDEWRLSFSGKCVCTEHGDKFTIQGENDSWSGFGADVSVFIRQRLPRIEAAGISANMPWASNDDVRDIIHVTCPTERGETPYFQITIWLPADAYQRVANVDLTKQAVSLWAETPLFGPGELPFVFGNDPDGRDQVWRIAVRPYEFLESVTIHLMPTASQKVSLDDQTVQANPDDEEPTTQVQQILDSAERAVVSIGELRSTIVRSAWLLVAVMVVTAFLR